MEPIRYFDAVELVEPRCTGCHHVIHYGKDAVFDDKKQILTCGFCGNVL